MTIEVQRREGINYVKLKGKMTLASGLGSSLRETFDGLLAKGERFFIFDMTETRYVDSAGLGTIVACHKQAQGRGATITLVIGERSTTRELLALTQLDRILDVSSDEDDALARFRL